MGLALIGPYAATNFAAIIYMCCRVIEVGTLAVVFGAVFIFNTWLGLGCGGYKVWCIGL